MVCSASKLQSAGQIDAAIEQYLATVRIARQLRSAGCDYGPDRYESFVYDQLPLWAAQTGQTADRIKKAIAELEEITADMPAGSQQIKYKYMQTKADLSEGFQSHVYITTANILWSKIPWERARALRLLNLLTNRDLEAVAQAESAVKDGRPIAVLPGREIFYDYYWTKESPYALREEIVIPPLI